MTQPYGNYQIEIYFQGLSGVLPSLPMSFDELQARAEQALPPSIRRAARVVVRAALPPRDSPASAHPDTGWAASPVAPGS